MFWVQKNIKMLQTFSVARKCFYPLALILFNGSVSSQEIEIPRNATSVNHQMGKLNFIKTILNRRLD